MAKKKKITKKKGNVYIQTDRGVFPFDVLKKAEIKQGSSSSKQLEQIDKWMTANELISPPYSFKSFLSLLESNPIFFRCVHQLAVDVAGLGWKIQLREGKKDNKAELNKINEFLNNPSDEDPFRSILKKLLVDWGSIGNFGLEVARNNKGDIGKIYYVPGYTIRVHISKKKYCQIRNNKKVWFKKFGEAKHISAKTGKEGTLRSKETRANELIYFKNHYPKSDYYGMPNILSAVGDVIGLVGLRDYNLSFFENYGVPAALITLEGEWETGSDKKISDFINKSLKGTDNAHRTLVVNQPEECKFHYEKLGIEVKEGSFRLYEQARREDILIAYSMPPERVGVRVVGKLGGNVAEEATIVYVQSVVEPLQLDVEDIINQQLLQSEIYEFKFKNIDLRDYDSLIKQLGYQIERGMKTPNEARNEIGLKPYAEGDQFFIMSSLVPVGEAEPEEGLSKEEKKFLKHEQNSWRDE